LDDAVERAHRCVEAGADYVFLEAPEHVEQMCQIPRLVSVPALANTIPGGKTPILLAGELQAMGFAAVVWPNAFTYAFVKAATEVAAKLLQTAQPRHSTIG
jgi:2,3-dimethylmalate lyase